MTMSPRDRVRAALRFEPADIVPYWIPMEREVAERLDADAEGRALRTQVVNHLFGWHGVGDHGDLDLGGGRSRSPWGYVKRRGAVDHLEQVALERPTLDGWAGWGTGLSIGAA